MPKVTPVKVVKAGVAGATAGATAGVSQVWKLLDNAVICLICKGEPIGKYLTDGNLCACEGACAEKFTHHYEQKLKQKGKNDRQIKASLKTTLRWEEIPNDNASQVSVQTEQDADIAMPLCDTS
eukprot:COSAG05_NODE_1237_length_5434_cov_7.991565_4_plen_124_part_00